MVPRWQLQRLPRGLPTALACSHVESGVVLGPLACCHRAARRCRGHDCCGELARDLVILCADRRAVGDRCDQSLHRGERRRASSNGSWWPWCPLVSRPRYSRLGCCAALGPTPTTLAPGTGSMRGHHARRATRANGRGNTVRGAGGATPPPGPGSGPSASTRRETTALSAAHPCARTYQNGEVLGELAAPR